MSLMKPVHPGEPQVDPGPTASPNVRRWFAEDNAYHSLLVKRWEEWVLNHPNDAEITAVHSFSVDPAAAVNSPTPLIAPPATAGRAGDELSGVGVSETPTPPTPPPPRPDGTTPRQRQSGASGL